MTDNKTINIFTRSWCESGIIVNAYHLQSSSIGFFAGKNILNVHDTGFWFLGVLSGMYETIELEDLRIYAYSIGVRSELRRTENRLAPSTLIVASCEIDLLNKVALKAKARLVPIDFEFDASNAHLRDNSKDFSDQYKLKKSILVSSEKNVSLDRFTRVQSQNVWKVQWSSGVFWTYSRDLAFLVYEFCVLGSKVVEVSGRELYFRSGRLPLTMARCLHGLGGYVSGPTTDRAAIGGISMLTLVKEDNVTQRKYKYTAPNAFVASKFEKILIETLNFIIKTGERID